MIAASSTQFPFIGTKKKSKGSEEGVRETSHVTVRAQLLILIPLDSQRDNGEVTLMRTARRRVPLEVPCFPSRVTVKYCSSH